jgi:ribosomal protein S4E
MNGGNVKINSKVRKDELFPVFAFDTINFEKLNKYYELEIVNRKFKLREVSKEDSLTKIIKISGKKNLANGKVQINLEDGNNFLTDMKFNVGDSVLLNTFTNKIEKILPLKVGAKVEIVSGKHAGGNGEILAIENIRRGKQYKVKMEDKEVTLPHKTFFVIK